MADWTRYGAGQTIHCPCPPPSDRRENPRFPDRRSQPRETCGRGLGEVEAGHVSFIRPYVQGTNVGSRHRCQRCGNLYQMQTVAQGADARPAA